MGDERADLKWLAGLSLECWLILQADFQTLGADPETKEAIPGDWRC